MIIDKFSVLMSVYHKEKPEYLNKALDSVFNQTIKPTEVVLVEDGTLTDDLENVVKDFQSKYSDSMKVVRFEKNRGLGKALHDGIFECSYNIVFRMDTDDIAVKNRFEKQLAIFNSMNVDVVGSNIVEYDEGMNTITGHRIVPETHEQIVKTMKKRNPMNHMTVAYKKDKVIESGNYLDMLYFEDYYLWARMIMNGCKFYNIQEDLVNARGGAEMVSRRGGIKYVKHIFNFEKALLKIKAISAFIFFENIFIRTIAAIIPQNIRAKLYKNALRK